MRRLQIALRNFSRQWPVVGPSQIVTGYSARTTVQIRYASKKKASHASSKRNHLKETEVNEDSDVIQVDSHPVPVIAKGKKAKAAQMTEEDAIEAFHLDRVEKDMDSSVERLRREIRTLIGRVGSLSPSQ